MPILDSTYCILQLDIPTLAKGCEKFLVIKHKEQWNMTIWAALSSKWELVHSHIVPELFKCAGSHVPMTEADTIAEAATVMLYL